MTIVGDHVYAMLVTPTVGARGEARRRRRSSSTSRSTRCATPSRRSRTASARPTRSTSRCRISSIPSCSGRSTPTCARCKHLIFEPDGAMLRLPAESAGDGPGVGRRLSASARRRATRPPSTSAASAGSAATATSARPSARARSRSCAPRRRRPGRKEYLGLGENTPPSASAAGAVPAAADRDCILPLSLLDPSDLRQGAAGRAGIVRTLRARRRRRSSPATSSPTPASRRATTSTSTASSISRPTAWSPRRAAKCAAQPALLTSFGGSGSDGLLTFREIFDLHLDADLVILSACDTAGKASAAATQQAGLSTGGDVALDGLVRAFVGAGGAAGGRQPLAGARRLQRDAAADHRPVLGAAGDADGDRASPVAAPTDGRPQHVAPILLVGVRGRRRWRNPGHPRASRRSPAASNRAYWSCCSVAAAGRRSGRSYTRGAGRFAESSADGVGRRSDEPDVPRRPGRPASCAGGRCGFFGTSLAGSAAAAAAIDKPPKAIRPHRTFIPRHARNKGKILSIGFR